MKITTDQWIRIVLAIGKAFREVGDRRRAARAEDSDGGKKITRHEAGEIVAAAFGAAVPAVVDILADEAA